MPTVWHLFYIPGILLLGITIGFRLGARAVREEAAREATRRKR